MSSQLPNELNAVLCPGQGAQHIGMGKAWAAASTIAAETFADADQILGFELSSICFEGPAEQLNRTDVAQAAIYTTSVACHRALKESGKLGMPTAAAGLSLGEFTALHLAGVFDFASGLRLVRFRGQAMQAAAEISPSGMVALTGADESQTESLCNEARGNGVLVPANFNCPGQVVISGSDDACQRAVVVAQKIGLRAKLLSVAGAFHSPLMRPAADGLSQALDEIDWHRPAVPVVSNVTGQAHDGDIDTIKLRLVEQLTSPVRWSIAMQWMIENVKATFVELAPGKVLAGLMRRIDRSVKVQSFADPDP